MNSNGFLKFSSLSVALPALRDWRLPPCQTKSLTTMTRMLTVCFNCCLVREATRQLRQFCSCRQPHIVHLRGALMAPGFVTTTSSSGSWTSSMAPERKPKCPHSAHSFVGMARYCARQHPGTRRFYGCATISRRDYFESSHARSALVFWGPSVMWLHRSGGPSIFFPTMFAHIDI